MSWLLKKTLKVRHRLVKALAPKIFKEHELLQAMVQTIPRPSVKFAKQYFSFKSNLKALEIGVAEGKNAESIQSELHVADLYLVDPYEPYVCAGGLHQDFHGSFAQAKDRLPNAHWFIGSSEEAAKQLWTERFDFIYIDGNHSYQYIKKDLELYYPLVKEGGILAGHDYVFDPSDVKTAVDEFAEKHQVWLYVSLPDWWIIK